MGGFCTTQEWKSKNLTNWMRGVYVKQNLSTYLIIEASKSFLGLKPKLLKAYFTQISKHLLYFGLKSELGML